MATLTPEIAKSLMERSMTTGVKTTEFNKYGGYDAVKKMWDSSGGHYSLEQIAPDDLRKYAEKIVATGVGNMSAPLMLGMDVPQATREKFVEAGVNLPTPQEFRYSANSTPAPNQNIPPRVPNRVPNTGGMFTGYQNNPTGYSNQFRPSWNPAGLVGAFAPRVPGPANTTDYQNPYANQVAENLRLFYGADNTVERKIPMLQDWYSSQGWNPGTPIQTLQPPPQTQAAAPAPQMPSTGGGGGSGGGSGGSGQVGSSGAGTSPGQGIMSNDTLNAVNAIASFLNHPLVKAVFPTQAALASAVRTGTFDAQLNSIANSFAAMGDFNSLADMGIGVYSDVNGNTMTVSTDALVKAVNDSFGDDATNQGFDWSQMGDYSAARETGGRSGYDGGFGGATDSGDGSGGGWGGFGGGSDTGDGW